MFFQLAGYDDYGFEHKGPLQHVSPIVADSPFSSGFSGSCFRVEDEEDGNKQAIKRTSLIVQGSLG